MGYQRAHCRARRPNPRCIPCTQGQPGGQDGAWGWQARTLAERRRGEEGARLNQASICHCIPTRSDGPSGILFARGKLLNGKGGDSRWWGWWWRGSRRRSWRGSGRWWWRGSRGWWWGGAWWWGRGFWGRRRSAQHRQHLPLHQRCGRLLVQSQTGRRAGLRSGGRRAQEAGACGWVAVLHG